MGTYSAWESAATLRLLGGAHGGAERGAGAYCVATRTACHIRRGADYLVAFRFDVQSVANSLLCFAAGGLPVQPISASRLAGS